MNVREISGLECLVFTDASLNKGIITINIITINIINIVKSNYTINPSDT